MTTIPARPVDRGALPDPSRVEEYALEIYSEQASDSDDPATKYVMVEYFPASARRIKKLSWTYERPGGCGELVCELAVPYDKYGLAAASRSLQHFQHVVLTVRGVRWWCGTIESVAPKLALPETVTLTARGYFRQAEKATISWNFARHQLKTAGDVGELPGVVRALWKLMPLLFGTETGFPNPLADTCYLVGSTARPHGMVLDNVTVKDVIDEAATLAGNYDWGVDENRQLYMVPPQALTPTTAMYTSDPARFIWAAAPTAGYGTYGDNTYWDPNPLPVDDYGVVATVEEQGHFVVGSNTISVDAKDSVQGSKNVLKIVAAPKRPGDPPQLFTVVDSTWLAYWKRRMTAKTATSFFSEEADVRRWGERRLQLLGPPQSEGSIRGICTTRRPIHPTGAVRLLDPEYGTDAYYRIQRVTYTYEQDDHLTVNVELAYQVPPDQYFAEQLRRDATIAQNALIGEQVPFIIYEHFTPYRDELRSADIV